MTRKRAVKLLMDRGYSRNLANGLMQNKPANNSNLQAYKKYLLFDRIVDATEKATKLCCAYGAAWDAIFNSLYSSLRWRLKDGGYEL